MTNTKFQRLRAVVVTIAVTGTIAVGASAASLGGLGTDNLGADSAAVGSCDTDGITYEFRQSFRRNRGEYRVNRVVLRDVSLDCRGLPYSITLFENGVGGASATTDGASLTVSNGGVARIRVRLFSDDVDGIALTIGGNPVAPQPGS